MQTTSAPRHFRRLERLHQITLAAVRRAWARMDAAGSWERQYQQDVGPKVVALAAGATVAATRESDSYAAEVLNELAFGPPTKPGVVVPQSLVGVMGDGRPVETLLASTVGRARALETKMAPEDALAGAGEFMDRIVESLMADAARAAEEVAMAQRPWVAGYVRVAEPGACSRCIILAGKFYLFNEGFLRHPACRCTHLPAPENKEQVSRLIGVNSPDRYFESLSKEEQDRVFTEAGAQAIREGADISRVVNARRGMSKAQNGALVTTEATTRRGRRSGQKRGVRLMPESIFAIAGDDREEALRLLRLHGYLN